MMARDFWQKRFASYHFHHIRFSPCVLWNPRGLTRVVETLWRRSGSSRRHSMMPQTPIRTGSRHGF